MIPQRQLARTAFGILDWHIVIQHGVIRPRGAEKQVHLVGVVVPAADQKSIAINITCIEHESQRIDRMDINRKTRS